MAGLRTPGEPPAIRVRCDNPLIAGTPFSTQEQSCDGFVRPGACPSRPWPQPGESKLVPAPVHRWHAGSIFGAGPRIPLDREQRARFRALLLLNRRPGRLTLSASIIGRVLLDMLGEDGRLDPSHATIAARACVSVATVLRALAQLRVCGFVTWVRRLARTAWRAEQTSSAYVLALPATPASYSKAILLRTSTKTTARSFRKSQAKVPSAIDVAAARDALERRRRVMEGRLMSGRTGASS
jgi:hypothetical protein